MSPASPGLICDDEVIVRMVCAPMHVHSKRPELKSSFFSHAFSKGASAQRVEHATDTELKDCVEQLIGGADDRVWLGYVQCRASAIRKIKIRESDGQTFCVYDAALPPGNPAHAEVHAARRIPEADEIEYRRELQKAFGAHAVLRRRGLRDGTVWAQLREDLKQRPLPPQWSALI